MTRPTKYIIHKSVKRAILLLLTILNIFVVFSQKFEIENKFHIKQEDKSIIFRVLDTDDSQLKKYNSKKYYYWFKSQKILITQGGSSGSLLNGDYESFYKNNQLAEKGLFKKGLKHGIWRFWGQNGILIHQENWSSGIQIGKQLYYSNQGLLEKTILYKSTQVQIIARDTTIIKTKKTVLTTVKDSVGKLIMQSRLKSGQLDGTQINRDQNDSLIKTVYKNGELVTKKTKAEKGSSEKKSFKEKMTNFWGKLKFWKKFKKKEGKVPKEKTEKQPKEKKEKTPKEPSQPKEKKKRNP
ncbi:toxin-antitoxin system YwqK family antitoxin [Fluviicola sp.]|uniref:toxin-antitoxin system YwqK family antitoxin n=1 Tax=Fluviicola sp. TaxID=1917219 RepID=UPI003D2852BA